VAFHGGSSRRETSFLEQVALKASNREQVKENFATCLLELLVTGTPLHRTNKIVQVSFRNKNLSSFC
jgi:hypothetical protein